MVFLLLAMLLLFLFMLIFSLLWRKKGFIKKLTYYYIFWLFVSLFLGIHYDLSLINPTKSMASAESNYLRVLSTYGLIGMFFYSYILGVFSTIFSEATEIVFSKCYFFSKEKWFSAVILLLLLGLFFVDQMITPYMISGYVSFSIFSILSFVLFLGLGSNKGE